MLNKGFIGPIGDDLPSLIPLLLGLVMFFSTFTLTFNTFDERNTEFNDDITVMRVLQTLQSNSYIFSHKNFENLCNELGIVNINFVAGLSDQAVLSVPGDTEGVENIFEIDFFDNDDGVFVCTNDGLGDSDLMEDYISLEETVDRTIISRIFPIVLEDEKIVKPMHIFMVAWK